MMTYKAALESIKGKAKTPIYLYSGLILVGVLVSLPTVFRTVSDFNNRKLILILKDPQVGDVISGHGSGGYFLNKVLEVRKDSVLVATSTYVPKEAEIADLRKKGDEAYPSEKHYWETRESYRMSFRMMSYIDAYR